MVYPFVCLWRLFVGVSSRRELQKKEEVMIMPRQKEKWIMNDPPEMVLEMPTIRIELMTLSLLVIRSTTEPSGLR